MIKYIRQPDEAGFLVRVPMDEDFPPPQAMPRPVLAVTALAAVLTVAACGRTEDVPVLFGTPDVNETWVNKVPPVIWNGQKAFLPDVEEIPAGNLRGVPDVNETWDNLVPPVTWYGQRAFPWGVDEDIPLLYGTPDENEVWTNWVKPVIWLGQRAFLPDQDEDVPLLFGTPDVNETWDNQVAPVTWLGQRAFLWGVDEDIPFLHGVYEEDFYNPPEPWALPRSTVFLSDDVVVQTSFTPDEDYWKWGTSWLPRNTTPVLWAADELPFINTGTIATVLEDLTFSASGNVINIGTGTLSLEDLTLSASGSVFNLGTLTSALENLLLNGTETEILSGTMASALENLVLSGVSTASITGDVIAALQNLEFRAETQLPGSDTGSMNIDLWCALVNLLARNWSWADATAKVNSMAVGTEDDYIANLADMEQNKVLMYAQAALPPAQRASWYSLNSYASPLYRFFKF